MGKGSQDTAAAKPATAAATPAKEQTRATEQASTAGVGTALQEKAAAEEAAKAGVPKSNLYTVASPIKHDGQDYAAGDAIRLPEATAHRLAGYLKA